MCDLPTVDITAATHDLTLVHHLGASELDVTVGRCPESLPSGRHIHPRIQVASDAVVVTYPTWSLLVERGVRATVDWRGEGAIPSWIVESWAASIAASQRGLLSLHATLVDINGAILAIAGKSGAGKSTTAVALQARGHTLVTDDVCLVDPDSSPMTVLPYSRSLHLTDHAVQRMGIDPTTGEPLSGIPGKSAFRQPDVDSAAKSLDCWITLRPVPDDLSPRLSRLHGHERLEALVEAGRAITGPAIMGEQRFFTAITKVADSVPTYVLERPADVWSLPSVTGIIEEVARTLP